MKGVGPRRLASPVSLRQELTKRTPGFGILAEQRIQVQTHIVCRIPLADCPNGRANLGRVRLEASSIRRFVFGGVVLDEAVLMRNTEHVEEGPHHRSMLSQMIENQRAGRERVGQPRKARQMASLPLQI